ncbi:2724_t:CDS:1, partial [Funneliformis mosseae]
MTLGLEELSLDFNNNLGLSNINTSRDILVLEDIIDFTLPLFDNTNNELHNEPKTQDIVDSPNLDYDSERL